MGWFVAGRLLAAVPVLFGVSVVVFLLLHFAPGDVASVLAGPMASEAIKQAIRESLGLDQPLPVQFLKWLGNLVHGDFGTSLVYKRPVAEFIFGKYFNTALMAVSAALLACVIGISIGTFAASKSHSLFDRVTMAITMVIGSTPLFWLGLILVLLFALTWRVFPATGMTSPIDGGGFVDVARHLVLPAVAAAMPSSAIISRTARSCMIDVLGQNYIRVARAKGLRRTLILRKHAFRNALPPIATVCGLELAFLLTGVFFVEVVFAWPGLGNALYYAIIAHDIPTVQASVLLIALSFVVINLAVDVLNAHLDPRIKVSADRRGG